TKTTLSRALPRHSPIDMKKRQKLSLRAAALQTAVSVVLMVISAILFASSFRAAPTASEDASLSAQPGFYPPLPTSSSPSQTGFYPPLPAQKPAQQPGFYPPLPDAVSNISVSLPVDTMDPSVPSSTVLIKPVICSNIDSNLNYVGFQADFTFDSSVVSFASP